MHLAVRHHVRPVGESDRALGPLLDEQHGHAASADLSERVEDDVHGGRSEPERRLVEEEHARPRDQRPRDRELLLLAARERPGLPGAELVDDGKQLLDPLEFAAGVGPVSARNQSEPRFSSTVSSAKIRRPSGTSETPPRAIVSGLRPTIEAPWTRMSPDRAGTRPTIVCSVVDLPAPFGPISPTISPAPTVSVSCLTAGTEP